MIEFSPYIEEVIAWLRRCGVTVHERAYLLPENVSGMYRSETNEIFLNEPSAEFALMTLAHEAGHWLGYLIEVKPERSERETQAYEYGWEVLKWFHAPVSRVLWDMYHDEDNQAISLSNRPATEHLYR